jgi:hypothetical protein
MAVIKNIPSQRIVNGKVINTSEVSVVSEPFYETHGEACIVIRGIAQSKERLDSISTDHTVIKAMTKVLIIPDIGKIDEEYDELFIDKGACVEFRFCAGVWYIISSDGLKMS